MLEWLFHDGAELLHGDGDEDEVFARDFDFETGTGDGMCPDVMFQRGVANEARGLFLVFVNNAAILRRDEIACDLNLFKVAIRDGHGRRDHSRCGFPEMTVRRDDSDRSGRTSESPAEAGKDSVEKSRAFQMRLAPRDDGGMRLDGGECAMRRELARDAFLQRG